MLVNQLDIEAISEESFNIEDSVLYASEYIKEQNKEELVIGNFEDKAWKVLYEQSASYLYFNFEPLHTYFSANTIMIDVVKCWVTFFLENRSLDTAKGHYTNLLLFIEQTNGFSKDYFDRYITYIEEEIGVKEETKSAHLFSVINFMEYYAECYFHDEFILELYRLKNKFCADSDNIRKIPSSRDVMKFSRCLEDYFETINPNSDDYIRYYPVLIWWKLTTIIPIRSGEFCNIRRNCLIHENNKVYLQLPRKKMSKKGVQIVDKILIPEEIYDLINIYMKITEPFGQTKNLLSYKAQFATSHRSATSKIFRDRYTLNVFKYILDAFYEKVLKEHFGLNVVPISDETKEDLQQIHYDIKQRLRPNDTRHLAFMNLYMQGFHPVEIARLGGHAKVSTQYGYQHHVEYWIDSEVEKAMANFNKTISAHENKKNTTDIPTLNEKLRLRAIFYCPTSDFKSPCEVGFCTDELRRCKTKTCYECTHWRIPEEDWEKAVDIINEEVRNKISNIKELHAFLNNLHKLILADKFSEINYRYSNQLTETTMEIRAEIDSIARLQLKKFQKG